MRLQPIVLMFVLAGVVFGAFSEGFDRLWEAHFLNDIGFPAWLNLPPVVWIGALHAGACSWASWSPRGCCVASTCMTHAPGPDAAGNHGVADRSRRHLRSGARLRRRYRRLLVRLRSAHAAIPDRNHLA